MSDTAYVCVTCGVQQAPAATPPAQCPICADERQYVNPAGQQWTTPEALRRSHAADWRALEPGLSGLGATPQIAIGQRGLVLSQPGGGVMWDPTPLVSAEGVARVRAEGGLRALACSHPHMFGAVVEWSEALDNAPIYLHTELRRYVQRPSAAIRYWSGESHDLGQGVTLIRCGGHFSGSTVLHWAGGAEGRGVLFGADTIMVAADTRWLSFMRSYPNYIPLNRRAVEAIAAAVRPHAFDRVYAAWWPGICEKDARLRLDRSVERYVAAIADGEDIS